jgi:hypothetical protein
MTKTIRFESSHAEWYPLQVQGESHYRENLEDVSGYVGEDEGVDADDFIAHLILEDDNINDSNAVRVEIDGKIVGYLARPAAKKYRARLIDLGLSDVIGECYASIKGGHIKRSTGEQADFGVRLDLDLDSFKERKEKPAAEKLVGVPPAETIHKQQIASSAPKHEHEAQQIASTRRSIPTKPASFLSKAIAILVIAGVIVIIIATFLPR